MRNLLLIFCVCVFGWGHAFAQDTDESRYEIIAPVESGQLFGLVEIIGTASHPSLFRSYSLEWSNAQNPDVWLPVQQPVSQQVTDSLLGQWDTVRIPDGVYQLRLRLSLTDDTERQVIIRGLAVANSAPTPLPTAELPQLPTNAPLTGESLINQPPAATPRPTFEQPNFEPSVSTRNTNSSEIFVTFDSAQAAVCNGALFSMIFFGVIVAYLLLRKQISPYTRRLWWQIRSEIEDTRDY